MNAAAYTLIGAGTVGVFSIAKDLLVEGRRDRAERTRTRRRELEDGRVACLLVGDELESLERHFSLLLKLGRSPDTPISESPFLPTREWHARKGELARVIDEIDTWKALGAIYHNAEGVRTRIISDPPATPMPPRMVEMVKEHVVDAKELAGILYDASAALDRGLAKSPSRLSPTRVLRATVALVPRPRGGRRRRPGADRS